MIKSPDVEMLAERPTTVGWTLLAAQGFSPVRPEGDAAGASGETPSNAPVRLRATITVDIDADTLAEAERGKAEILSQYEFLRQALPAAVLAFQRRKPRTGPRAPRPALIVSPYVDD
jgi:hypothetical protein